MNFEQRVTDSALFFVGIFVGGIISHLATTDATMIIGIAGIIYNILRLCEKLIKLR